MSQQKFKGTVQAGERGRVFIATPFNPSEVWGVKTRHHVRGTINGMSFRGSLGSEDGTYFMVLGATCRRDCGIAVGDKVTVVLEPEGPQQDALAQDIADALAADPKASTFFNGLATFYRKGYIKWIEATKRRPETRAARINEMMTLLRAEKKQK